MRGGLAGGASQAARRGQVGHHHLMTAERHGAPQLVDRGLVLAGAQMNGALQPVGAVEIRIALDHLRGLLRRLGWLAGGEVGPADVHVDERRERVERQRLPAATIASSTRPSKARNNA